MTCFDPDPARSTFDLPFEVATLGWRRSSARPTGPGPPSGVPALSTASDPPSDAGSSPSGR